MTALDGRERGHAREVPADFGLRRGQHPAEEEEFAADEGASVDELTRASKVVFSASLEEPLACANSTLVRDDAVEAVRSMKDGSGLLSTIGSLSFRRCCERDL